HPKSRSDNNQREESCSLHKTLLDERHWKDRRAGASRARWSHPTYSGPENSFCSSHHLQNATAKVGQVVGFAAADEMAVDHDGGIFPHRAGVDQIVLDAGRAGDANAAINAGGDRNPAAVADGGDEFAGFVEIADELQHVAVAAELVGHEAAGNDDAIEVASPHAGDGSVGDARIAV